MRDPSQLILSISLVVALVTAALAVWLRRSALQRAEQPPAPPIGKVPCWFFQPSDLIAVLMVYLFLGGLTLLNTMAPPQESAPISAGDMLIGISLYLILTAAVVAVAIRRCSVNQWLGLRWSGWPSLLLIGPGAVLLMGFIAWVIQRCGYMKWVESLEVDTAQETVTILQESNDPLVVGLLVVMATVVAPLWEEIVFRGFLYPVLKKFGGIWVSALCTSLFFSTVHDNLAALLPLFLLGLLLVWIYERTGSIWAPITAHFCFNATTVTIMLAKRSEGLPQALIWP